MLRTVCEEKGVEYAIEYAEHAPKDTLLHSKSFSDKLWSSSHPGCPRVNLSSSYLPRKRLDKNFHYVAIRPIRGRLT